MAFSTIRSIIRANHVTVVGSAPLTASAQLAIQDPDTKIICVNGSISSVQRIPDIWFLNSRQYDEYIYTNPDIWPPWRQELHERMMQQATNRTIRHILFLLKNDHPNQTIDKLRSLNVKWRAHSVINSGVRTDFTRRAGVHKFSTAFNISAGLFGLALSLALNAKHVTLCGFSFSNDYAYLPETPSNAARLHIAQDQEALPELQAKNGDRFTIL